MCRGWEWDWRVEPVLELKLVVLVSVSVLVSALVSVLVFAVVLGLDGLEVGIGKERTRPD